MSMIFTNLCTLQQIYGWWSCCKVTWTPILLSCSISCPQPSVKLHCSLQYQQYYLLFEKTVPMKQLWNVWRQNVLTSCDKNLGNMLQQPMSYPDEGQRSSCDGHQTGLDSSCSKLNTQTKHYISNSFCQIRWSCY